MLQHASNKLGSFQSRHARDAERTNVLGQILGRLSRFPVRVLEHAERRAPGSGFAFAEMRRQ